MASSTTLINNDFPPCPILKKNQSDIYDNFSQKHYANCKKIKMNLQVTKS
jgi:hypothetical protein